MSEQETAFTFFFGAHDPLSNWHPARFVVKGISFCSNEQFMMYCKAMLFGDHDNAAKILAASEPKEQKALGRQVRGFDEAVWSKRRERFVYGGALAKFSSNPLLACRLLETDGTELVEASPYDRIWGVGLAADDPRILDRTQWRGENLLGKVLMQVREVLKADFPDGLVASAQRQAVCLQLQEWQSALWETLYPVGCSTPKDARLREHAQATYMVSVKAREIIFGRDAACHEVDTVLWSDFSDLFKDRNGYRPRCAMTRASVLQWFDEDAKAHPAGSEPPAEPRQLGAHERQIQAQLAGFGLKMAYLPGADPAQYFVPPFSAGWVVVAEDGKPVAPALVPADARALACYF